MDNLRSIWIYQCNFYLPNIDIGTLLGKLNYLPNKKLAFFYFTESSSEQIIGFSSIIIPNRTNYGVINSRNGVYKVAFEIKSNLDIILIQNDKMAAHFMGIFLIEL